MHDVWNSKDEAATLSREAWKNALAEAKKVREPTRKQVEGVAKT